MILFKLTAITMSAPSALHRETGTGFTSAPSGIYVNENLREIPANHWTVSESGLWYLTGANSPGTAELARIAETRDPLVNQTSRPVLTGKYTWGIWNTWDLLPLHQIVYEAFRFRNLWLQQVQAISQWLCHHWWNLRHFFSAMLSQQAQVRHEKKQTICQIGN